MNNRMKQLLAAIIAIALCITLAIPSLAAEEVSTLQNREIALAGDEYNMSEPVDMEDNFVLEGTDIPVDDADAPDSAEYDAEDIFEEPIAASDTSTEQIVEISEIPETIEETVETPEVTEEAPEVQEVSEENIKIPEIAEEFAEISEAANESMTAEEIAEMPETTEEFVVTEEITAIPETAEEIIAEEETIVSEEIAAVPETAEEIIAAEEAIVAEESMVSEEIAAVPEMPEETIAAEDPVVTEEIVTVPETAEETIAAEDPMVTEEIVTVPDTAEETMIAEEVIAVPETPEEATVIQKTTETSEATEEIPEAPETTITQETSEAPETTWKALEDTAAPTKNTETTASEETVVDAKDSEETEEGAVSDLEETNQPINTEDPEQPDDAEESPEEDDITLFAGNSMNTATGISFGTTYSGKITSSNTIDYYRFTLNSSGKISLTVTAHMEYVYLKLYDSAGSELFNSTPYWNTTTNQSNNTYTRNLTAGTYYFAVKKHGSRTGSYTFRINYTNANETFPESGSGINNSMDTANAITFNWTYYGQIAYNDVKDFFVFTLPTSGKLTFDFIAKMEYIYIKIYDQNGNEMCSKTPYWNSTAGQSSNTYSIELTSGKYYLAAAKHGSRTGNYSFQLRFSSANETFRETGFGTNNSMDNASSIRLAATYNGQIAYNDNKDFYKFTVTNTGKIVIDVTAKMEYVNLKVFDTDGNQLLSKTPYWNSTSRYSRTSYNLSLSPGTYYFSVSKNGSRTGDYYFRITHLINGFNYINGVWGYYRDGALLTGWTGLVKGTINNTTGYFYISNGVFTRATGITQLADGSRPNWYYVQNGIYRKKTGIAQRADGSSSRWFYVQNGIYCKKTGIAQRADGSSSRWFYVQNGIYCKKTGIARRADGSNLTWYYVQNGIYRKVTTIAKKADGSSNCRYYVKNGYYTRYTGKVVINDTTYTIKKGIVQ